MKKESTKKINLNPTTNFSHKNTQRDTKKKGEKIEDRGRMTDETMMVGTPSN